jgi:hypothetical protein
MNDAATESHKRDDAGLIRLGGLAMLIGLAIHIVANGVLKVFPPENPSLSELQSYLSDEAGTWAIVHGIRYVAMVCIVLFVAGLFVRTCCTRSSSNMGWGIVGLLGAGMMVINLLITNGIETLAFMDFDRLSQQADTFWTLFYLTRTLFTAEIVAWAILYLGFGMAGLQSHTLPKWIIWLGFFAAANGLLTGLFIVPVLNDNWQGIFVTLAALPGIIWFISVSVYMVLRGDS